MGSESHVAGGASKANWAIVLAIVLTVGGIVALGVSVPRAIPPLNFGTDEEYASIQRGRQLLPVPFGLFVGAGFLLFRSGRRGFAAVIAACGLVPVGLAYAFPDSYFATPSLLFVVPAVLIALLLLGFQVRQQRDE